MTAAQRKLQELRARQSRERQRMAELGLADKLTDETRSELDTLESGIPDLERQIRAAQTTVEHEESEQRAAVQDAQPDGEDRERAELRGKVRLSRYMEAALETRAADGAEAEYNAAVKLPGNRFPLELLAPERRSAGTEERATTNVDAASTQSLWLDRLFSDTAAMRVGVTFRSVMPGVASYPVTTAGAAADQLGRTQGASDASWTVGVTELKPSRNTVRAVFSEEDAMRLPGLEDALRRDLGMALTEGIDRAIFLGDSGASEDGADITGLATVTAAASGLTESTLTQANKLLAPQTLAVFADMIDGKHAASMGDLRVVTSVGANTLWLSTIAKAAADTKTVGHFLRENGLSWGIRGDIDTATAAGDFGAFVGRNRGIEGAAVAAVWNSGMFTRDPYTGAAKGECALTLSYFWDFGLVRPSNFRRVKFVA